MAAWKESIYRKHPWIIPIVPFIILFFVVHGIISYFLAMLCPLKVWTSFNRFGSKLAGWIPKVEVVREFTHAGFECLVHKKKSGSLYGRVILPKEHPYYGKRPWELPDSLYQLGRFTYGTPFQGTSQWYVEIATSEMYARYEAKDPIDFMTSKTKQLAEQLAIKGEPGSTRNPLCWSEPGQRRKPVKMSEPYRESNPGMMSEPRRGRKPTELSEPMLERNPLCWSEPIKERKPRMPSEPGA